MQSTHVLTDTYTIHFDMCLHLFRKSTCSKFKEVLKKAPPCCRISQSHPFCHMLAKNLATLLHLSDPQVSQSTQQTLYHLPHRATEWINHM